MIRVASIAGFNIGFPLLMAQRKQPIKAFTIDANTRLSELSSDVWVWRTPDAHAQKIQFRAIWDTGATHTSVTKHVARKCALQQVGTTFVRTPSTIEPQRVSTYRVNIIIPNGVMFENHLVSESESLAGDADILIGMDIIGEGDFAVSSFQGRTTFTFRIPSIERIDFARKESNAL